MADFGWFRMGQRSYAPNAPQSPTSPRSDPSRVPSHPSLASHSSFSHGPLTGNSDTSLLVREQDKIWTRGILQPIPIEYNSYILHLIEGFADAQEQIQKADIDRAEARNSLEHHLEHFKAVADEWLEREHQYKAEIKRLEVLLSRTSRDGLEAVTLARTNSVIDRNGPQAKQFVSKLKRLDMSSDLPYVADKHTSDPTTKVLDRANDFLVSEKMRRQDAATNATMARAEDRSSRHEIVLAQRPINNTLVTKRKTERPISLVRDTELQPLFSDDVFDVANVNDKELRESEESPPHGRQSRRHILENLLDCETSQSSGKDMPIGGKVGKRSSIAGLNQALEGPSIHSLDSRHLRGLSSMSGFSFVPGDDASPILLSSGARDETTVAIPIREGGSSHNDNDDYNKDIIELQQYAQEDKANSMHGLTTSMRPLVVKRVSGQESSARKEGKVIWAVNETKSVTGQRSSSTEMRTAPLVDYHEDRSRNFNSASKFSVGPAKLLPQQRTGDVASDD
ncbi:uncharacterized protein F4807DRAFT_470568 [Annulohypoxylon truncatum]|uniref:uncharacterized protein n=1 Tax=Annulohypoxylon truncatum TaxID=327061 RepID=UPI0020087121|nr:uncharacterized protein F4807DRAFT_470568 [Annulohypoxylon truncatum]KAI1205994.1 hypothetical protein F4807DRAFT_470568 [Annulohypoxylon truncatum]